MFRQIILLYTKKFSIFCFTIERFVSYFSVCFFNDNRSATLVIFNRRVFAFLHHTATSSDKLYVLNEAIINYR